MINLDSPNMINIYVHSLAAKFAVQTPLITLVLFLTFFSQTAKEDWETSCLYMLHHGYGYNFNYFLYIYETLYTYNSIRVSSVYATSWVWV